MSLAIRSSCIGSAIRCLAPRMCLSTVTPRTKAVAERSLVDMSQLIQQTVQTKFALHPFAKSVTAGNIERVMGRYLAMSEAFPYVQAGAYKDVIRRSLSRDKPITPQVEKTFVAGSFLCWDETGGNYLLQTKGMKALSESLDTREHFHASLLRKDLAILFQRKVDPDYCDATKTYLTSLMKQLGAEDDLKRGASMVAFETHAEQMIAALWSSLAKISAIDKEKLIYFQIHVGGDDPAEAHHVALTQRLIRELISDEQQKKFIRQFVKYYAFNTAWCKRICE